MKDKKIIVVMGGPSSEAEVSRRSAAAVLAALVWCPRFCGDLPSSIVISILALAVVVRHHANIARLMRGTEARFSFTAAQKAREEARRAERGIQS